MRNFSKYIFIFTAFFLVGLTQARADFFLAAHLLLNSLAVNYLPDYASTTYHGSYIGGSHGYRWELGDAYKLSSDTEGSAKSSPSLLAGYQFLRSPSHKFAITYERKSANFKGENDLEGKDIMDSFGLRFNFGMFAIKMGWTNHALDDDANNKHDGGYFTGFGFDFYFERFSIFFDLTDHYLEDRDIHLAGGDIGFRYSFGEVGGGGS